MTTLSFSWSRTMPLFHHAVESKKIRLVFSSFSGAGIALAFEPFLFWPALFFTALFGYVLFLSKGKKEAFLHSMLFSFFMYLSNLYWVANAFKTVGLWYLMPIAYLLFPLYLSFSTGLGSYLAWNASKNSPHHSLKALALGAGLNLGFCLQFLGPLGFPWVIFGYAFTLPLLQSTSLFGIEGLSFLVVFFALSPFSRSIRYTSFFAIILGALTLFGLWRLSDPTHLTPYNFRLIQPSLDQETKWDPDQVQKNLQIQGLLSQLEAEKPVQAVLWPEASASFFLERYPEIQKMLGNAAPQGGYLILGTLLEENETPYNSLAILDEHGILKGSYDKKHLVPFGEYVPFRALLPGVEKLTHGSRDFGEGKKATVLEVPGIPPFRALICYEALFSRETQSKKDEKDPLWLLNITNDAWYGHSSGPYQHARVAMVRAIEQGLPLVRVANNGISLITDAYGRVQQHLKLNDIGMIDFTLPQPLEKTFYQTYGNLFVFLLILSNSFILLGIYRWTKRILTRNNAIPLTYT